MSATPEEPYQPLAPISGGFHPLHGYADEGLFGYQELSATPAEQPGTPSAPPARAAKPTGGTGERLTRRFNSRRARGAATPS